MRLGPRPHVDEQPMPVLDARFRYGVGHRNPPVIALVPRGAIALEDLQSLGRQTDRLRQRLDQDLVVTGLARRRPEAVREHRDKRGLGDRTVCEIEARVAAERGVPGVLQTPLGRCEQARDFDALSGVRL
jgi:hypothetical protein